MEGDTLELRAGPGRAASGQVEELQAALADARSRAVAAAAKAGRLQGELEEIRRSRDEARQRLVDFERWRQSLDQESVIGLKRLREVEGENDRLRQERDELRQQLDYRERVEEEKRRLAERDRRLESEVLGETKDRNINAEAEREIHRLSFMLANMKEKVHKLEREMNERQDYSANYSKRLQSLFIVLQRYLKKPVERNQEEEAESAAHRVTKSVVSKSARAAAAPPKKSIESIHGTMVKRIVDEMDQTVRDLVQCLSSQLLPSNNNNVTHQFATRGGTDSAKPNQIAGDSSDVPSRHNRPETQGKEKSDAAGKRRRRPDISGIFAGMVDTTLLDLCDALEEETASLKSQLAQYQRDLSDAQTAFEGKDKLVAEYRLAMIRCKGEKSAITGKLRLEKEETERLRQEVRKFQEQIHTMETDYTSRINRIEWEISENAQKDKRKISQLETELAERDRIHERLEEERAQLSALLQRQRTEIQYLKAFLEASTLYPDSPTDRNKSNKVSEAARNTLSRRKSARKLSASRKHGEGLGNKYDRDSHYSASRREEVRETTKPRQDASPSPGIKHVISPREAKFVGPRPVMPRVLAKTSSDSSSRKGTIGADTAWWNSAPAASATRANGRKRNRNIPRRNEEAQDSPTDSRLDVSDFYSIELSPLQQMEEVHLREHKERSKALRGKHDAREKRKKSGGTRVEEEPRRGRDENVNHRNDQLHARHTSDSEYDSAVFVDDEDIGVPTHGKFERAPSTKPTTGDQDRSKLLPKSSIESSESSEEEELLHEEANLSLPMAKLKSDLQQLDREIEQLESHLHRSTST